MQKTWVQAHIQKDPTSHGTNACAVHQEKPLQRGAWARQLEKARTAMNTQHSQK